MLEAQECWSNILYEKVFLPPPLFIYFGPEGWNRRERILNM